MSISKNTKITFAPGPGALIPEWTNSQKEFLEEVIKYSKIKKNN